MQSKNLTPEAAIPYGDHNTLFRHFPTDVTLYRDDVAPIIRRAIDYYGSDEWRAMVLTMELHGHMGLYALIGVKMGCHALKRLEVMRGNLTVRSLAGLQPPISCLNDGLQVATGATLGHGAIEAEATQSPQLAAIFRSGNRALKLALRHDVTMLITDEVKDLVKECGNDTPEYWAAIRALAIERWVRFDRRSIFEVSEL